MNQERCPTVLGTDEHFFSKKQGYATTLCNLRKHKIFDIVKGRSAKELADYLTKLPEKEHVKVVYIDLSRNYRSLVQSIFPMRRSWSTVFMSFVCCYICACKPTKKLTPA